MAAYSKNLPPRAPWGPFVIPDQGCYYPWPFWPGPQLTPHYTPPPTVTPHDKPPEPVWPQDQPIPQATPQDQPQRVPPPPSIGFPQPPSSAPQGNPSTMAHWVGFQDGRKDVWRPDRFVSQRDQMQYRAGWKQGKQRRRFATNPVRAGKHYVSTHPTK